MKLFTLLTLVSLASCVPVTPSGSNTSTPLEYTNKDYTDRVGNVQLQSTSRTAGYGNPITPLGSSFLLKFDLLDEDFAYLSAKIYHCNFDWTPSVLSDLEILENYNEYPINDYEFSQNTIQPYVSYQLRLPPVRRSGNYIVAIFDSSKGLLFSRRFMVYEQKVGVNAGIQRSTGISERNSHHQLEFDINYGSLKVVDPSRDIMPIILQNHNWNTVISGLTPTSARIDKQFLEYKHFNQENNIPAINEFRFFDIRTLSYRGRSIETIGMSNRGIEAIVQPQKSRNGSAYSEPFEEDLNGDFVLANRDPNEMDIQSEYVWTNFIIKNEKVYGQVFVTGKFNNWTLSDRNTLTYDEVQQSYRGSIRLKQGFYNYTFWVESPDLPHYHFEGSHFQTTNEYEVLVYFREMGTVFDQLVGYALF